MKAELKARRKTEGAFADPITTDKPAVSGAAMPIASDPELDEQLEPHARKIEFLQTTAILQIASEAARAHTLHTPKGKSGKSRN
jgi:hypothetical protein